MEQRPLLCPGDARPRREPSPALPAPGALVLCLAGRGGSHGCTLPASVISQSLSHLCHSLLEKRELRGNLLWKITIMLLVEQKGTVLLKLTIPRVSLPHKYPITCSETTHTLYCSYICPAIFHAG